MHTNPDNHSNINIKEIVKNKVHLTMLFAQKRVKKRVCQGVKYGGYDISDHYNDGYRKV